MKKHGRMMRMVLIFCFLISLAACTAAGSDTTAKSGAGADAADRTGDVLVYGSGDYTRINPAMDEHGEINILLFDGLTAHNGENEIVPGLAREWTWDETACTYTFYLEEGVRWHDGQEFTAKDVKFTIEAIMDPENGSENAPDFEDVEEITVVDTYTISFKLASANIAFLEYMTMPILPQHLLAGEDMREADFFRAPVGTGPYRLEAWDEGQAITLVKNEGYFKGAPHIGTIVFKIAADDTARAMQMQAGELDLALLTPQDCERFEGQEGYEVYHMQTSDYRGIMFNFRHAYWEENRDLIPAICRALDRQAIVDTVLLGHGIPAYGPLQRNRYNCDQVERYEYDVERARQVLEEAGCVKGEDGFYERNGETVGFVLSVGAGDQVRLSIAQAAAQMLGEAGIRCTVEIPERVDWGGQMAYLIGWGSPFDADDHTYKVFATDKGANYSAYSNADVDRYLVEARRTAEPKQREEAYAGFQKALSEDPAFAFICYIDADYVANASIRGIDADTVMGHHGVGIFWNVTEWTME